jgi:flagellar hook-associated protein 3 FlgL
MRISTNMIFDAGVTGINRQAAATLKLSEQLATGRRIVTPADDPVGAAQALQVQQAKDINTQFATNLDNATSALGLEDTQLSTLNDIFGRIKTLTVQAGNSTLATADRSAIAVELRARFEDLVNIANATDGSGQHLFSGYMGNTQPFAGSVDGLVAAPASEISYLGDDGQRTLAISPSSQLAISDSGKDVFMRIAGGNGIFTTDYANGNTGSGVVSAGTVTNPAAWNSAANSKNLEVRFWVDAAGAVGPANTTYYDLVDATTSLSLYTNTASTTGAGGTYTHAYTANQAINFSGLAAAYNDFGISVSVSGSPANGDSFAIQASSSRSVFRTLANLIGALERGTTSPGAQAKYAVDIGSALLNLEQSSDNFQRVRAAVGSRLNEVESQQSLNGDLNLQYAQTLSSIQDLDYVKAISDLTQKQTQLEAAQKSFSAVSKLSLFNYI